MQRSTSSILVVAAAMAASCAFNDGSGWGVAAVDFSSSFETDGRDVEPGVFRTAKNLQIQLSDLDVEYADVTLGMSSESVGEFDPANPPEGFSNCHNGHCHADAGGIVEFADIPLGGDAAFTLIREVPAVVSLTDVPETVALCDDCLLYTSPSPRD